MNNERINSPNEVSGLMAVSQHPSPDGQKASPRKKRAARKPPVEGEALAELPAPARSPEDEHSIDFLA